MTETADEAKLYTVGDVVRRRCVVLEADDCVTSFRAAHPSRGRCQKAVFTATMRRSVAVDGEDEDACD